MYIETSLPQRPGHDATLISPVIKGQAEDLCMRFYYHAYGDDTGILMVKLNIVDLGFTTVEFTLTGDQGNEVATG